jgi:hypothetical protein
MEPTVMLRKRLSVLIGSLVLAGVLGIIFVRVSLGSQAGPSIAATPVSADLPHREVSDDIESPTISFIDSPSATCYRPIVATGACYIQWNYLNVTAASGSYVVSMTVTIDDHLRAYHSGFFQTSMYIPADMTAPGYKVTCGVPGSGGTDEWGNTYSYVIRARDTDGLKAANYGFVTCPADVVTNFAPFLRKN